MPAASRIKDDHTCPLVDDKAHVGGEVTNGEKTLLIGGSPAARVRDVLKCQGPADSIVKGASTVKIGGKEAARMSDETAHGGKLVGSCPTVRIGDTPQGAALMSAGAPLVERCEKPGDAPSV